MEELQQNALQEQNAFQLENDNPNAPQPDVVIDNEVQLDDGDEKGDIMGEVSELTDNPNSKGVEGETDQSVQEGQAPFGEEQQVDQKERENQNHKLNSSQSGATLEQQPDEQTLLFHEDNEFYPPNRSLESRDEDEHDHLPAGHDDEHDDGNASQDPGHIDIQTRDEESQEDYEEDYEDPEEQDSHDQEGQSPQFEPFSPVEKTQESAQNLLEEAQEQLAMVTSESNDEYPPSRDESNKEFLSTSLPPLEHDVYAVAVIAVDLAVAVSLPLPPSDENE
ncbi:hypothetical protein P3T76_003669 [Phytophthora citrophthora]|uniref:Uncharacterized protein n=1 Tax=Phytophthora citrophthora TaxID=4793 RepID=A0AAD9GW28_9STRA|nr:hypothetical protein P3T76_003669 [Phytophthora citrophthora]